MKSKNLLIIAGLLVVLAAGWIIYNRYRVVIPPVDITKSEVGWSAKSISDTHEGKVSLSEARLEFSNGKLTGGMFVADMNTIVVTDIADSTDNSHFVAHLTDEDFFETNKFPTASFVITGVTPGENNRYDIAGNMKIKNVEQPVNFEAVMVDDEAGKRLTAQFTIDRTRFGIEYGAQGKRGSEKDWFILNDIFLKVNIVAGK
jgi:polyisoprenoid-binding protein YceI